VVGSEGAVRAFAMDVEIAVLAVDRMPFDLAGVVGDITP
jgi:hypothetical protein